METEDEWLERICREFRERLYKVFAGMREDIKILVKTKKWEPKPGDICWVWEKGQIDKEIRKFVGKKDGKYLFTTYNMRYDGIPWEYFEPAFPPKLGITLWIATDRSGLTYVFRDKPTKGEMTFFGGGEGIVITKDIKTQTFEDGEMKIEI